VVVAAGVTFALRSVVSVAESDIAPLRGGLIGKTTSVDHGNNGRCVTRHESMIPKSGYPVFGQDHAPPIGQSGMTMRS
jgi:hypothetical protein